MSIRFKPTEEANLFIAIPASELKVYRSSIGDQVSIVMIDPEEGFMQAATRINSDQAAVLYAFLASEFGFGSVDYEAGYETGLANGFVNGYKEGFDDGFEAAEGSFGARLAESVGA